MSEAKKKVYIATRLFNVHDRLNSALLCDKVEDWIRWEALDGKLKELDEKCFLPFRDSNDKVDKYLESNHDDLYKKLKNAELNQEERHKLSDIVSRFIYEEDVKNMKENCGMLVAYFDGPTYDSGMGFEIGYMWAIGKPSYLLTTDYLKTGDGDSYVGKVSIAEEPQYTISKYVANIAHVISYEGFPKEVTPPTDYTKKCQEHQAHAQEALWERIKECGLDLPATLNREEIDAAAQKKEFDFYLDPNFKYDIGGLALRNAIINCGVSGKFAEDDGKGTKESAKTQIEKLAKSKVYIAYAQDMDADVDSAVLQGIAKGLGIPCCIISTKRKKYYSYLYDFHKNLMVACSANALLDLSGEENDDLANVLAEAEAGIENKALKDCLRSALESVLNEAK